ncbi:MAG TPA: EAL domain-containing protein, partial [Gemmatimonadales bacterium]|nr:EAL domain-containing protein [Gemmatimonadales bacterium]
GLIVPIGSWVLRESCRLARSWQVRFPEAGPVRLGVNLSPRQLGHPGIVDDVRTALQTTGLPANLLVIELTETVLTESTNASAGLLRGLRGLGVDIYMDDFGTGYSSLSRLAGFQLQGIKVHHSFVHRMGARRRDLAIVRSIVDLAGTLGLRVIAEGVESVAQRERLIAFGCELGQGLLFGGPLDPEGASGVLAAPWPPATSIRDVALPPHAAARRSSVRY